MSSPGRNVGKKSAQISFLYFLVLFTSLSTPTFAARCGGDFHTFVQNISADATAAGISPGVVSSARIAVCL
jgi:hypothetical protein